MEWQKKTPGDFCDPWTENFWQNLVKSRKSVFCPSDPPRPTEYCVYTIRDTETDEVIYVGSTCDFEQRKRTYLKSNRNSNHNVAQYMIQYEKWKERFVINEEKQYNTKKEMLDGEKELTKKMRPKCNTMNNPLYYLNHHKRLRNCRKSNETETEDLRDVFLRLKKSKRNIKSNK